MVNFGSAIKKYRSAAKLTQKQLAQDLSITPAYLSALENGHKESSLSLLTAICKALNVPREILFWEAVEITDGMSEEDKKTVEIAKVIIRHYFENSN